MYIKTVPKTYDEQYAEAAHIWEQAHPGQDYDEHINNLVDEHRLDTKDHP